MKKSIAICLISLIIILIGCGPSSNRIDPESGSAMDAKWDPLKNFIGSWTANEDGGPEQGRGERHYRPIIQDKYLYFTNRSVFEPSEKRPEGETHEDLGIFSFDQEKETFVLRQFHGEGFVNRYVLQEHSEDYKTMVFVSDYIENGPPGMRARLTYTVLNENVFHETFDLAMPGKKFVCYIENEWKRQSFID